MSPMHMSFKTVDAYLAALPGDQHALLVHLRDLIKSTAPEAVESISYGMPAYKYMGTPLVYFGAAKHHVALYAVTTLLPEDVLKELEWFSRSKGTIRFTSDHRLPDKLVKKIVKVRMEQNEEKARTKGKKNQSYVK